jgi:hypothetical protein
MQTPGVAASAVEVSKDGLTPTEATADWPRKNLDLTTQGQENVSSLAAKSPEPADDDGEHTPLHGVHKVVYDLLHSLHNGRDTMLKA